MDSETYGKINATLTHLQSAYDELFKGVFILNELIAGADATNDVAKYRQQRLFNGTLLAEVNEKDKIKNVVLNLLKEKSPDVGTSGENVGFVEFNEKELQQMPKQFKTEYRINKKTVHVRHHKNGPNSYTYEMRYRANGYNVSACGKTIEKAKTRFIEKMKTAKPETKTTSNIPTTFQSFALYHFEHFRKNRVSARTYKNDMCRMTVHIFPHFGETLINRITPAQCQKLIDKLAGENKMKTADEVYSLLSIVLKSAILHGIIDRNPLQLVSNVQYESEHGSALSTKEQQILLSAVDDTPYRSAFALALFTGLRPNEYKTARIEGFFIIAVNSKRHTKKVEYKKIPICKRLAKYLAETPINFPCARYMREKVKEVLPNHKLYDLRTTFYSKCKELGVAEPALKEYAGHSSGVIGNAYTDLSDAYLLKEGKKLDLW